MGTEHDSWLEGIGVSFDSSDANASMTSGLGEMVKSGLDAVGHVAGAGLDIAKGVFNEDRAIVEHVAAAGLDIAGAHDTGDSVRKDALAAQNRAAQDFKDAGGELGKAKDDVFGGDTTAQRVGKTRGGAGAAGGGGQVPGKGNAMRPDCKVVRGKVPGPVNHVLCGTHGHILDLGSKTIIANSLEQYKKTYGKGGGGSGGYTGGSAGGSGGGNYGGQGRGGDAPGKQKGGMRSTDVPDYGYAQNSSGVGMAERPGQRPQYGGDQDEGYGEKPQQPTYPEGPESPDYEGDGGGG